VQCGYERGDSEYPAREGKKEVVPEETDDCLIELRPW
jgi:hypothetical protein